MEFWMFIDRFRGRDEAEHPENENPNVETRLFQCLILTSVSLYMLVRFYLTITALMFQLFHQYPRTRVPFGIFCLGTGQLLGYFISDFCVCYMCAMEYLPTQIIDDLNEDVYYGPY